MKQQGNIRLDYRDVGQPQVQSAGQELPVQADTQRWASSLRPGHHHLRDAALVDAAGAKYGLTVEIERDRGVILTASRQFRQRCSHKGDVRGVEVAPRPHAGRSRDDFPDLGKTTFLVDRYVEGPGTEP